MRIATAHARLPARASLRRARPLLTAALGLLLGVASACKRDTTTPPQPGDSGSPATSDAGPWSALEPLDGARLRAHLEFLAADAQEGRAPGTEADQRVRAHIITAMKEIGLRPGFSGDRFEQAFDVTDGVRVVDGKSDMLAAGKRIITHNLVPWGHSTRESGPVMSRLYYVGYGIAGDQPWTGDYENLKGRVDGRIVVARAGGPDDPHLDPAKVRPQTKLITAREHGAAGFVLWEPDVAAPYPNHGRVNDLQIPAVTVGKDGTEALLRAFGVKLPKRSKAPPDPHFGLSAGTKSKPQGVIDTPVEPIVLQTANVVGVLPGNGSSSKRIVIGAHMDHLGMGNNSSLAPGEHAVHNGADDNASGVATVLELARVLAKIPASERPYDIEFVAFAAEEMGLLGSKHLVKTLAEGGAGPSDAIVAMLNFDMVGRLRDNTVIVSGAGTSTLWPDLIEKTRADLLVKTDQKGYGASDQTSFYEVGIPVLHFFTGAHDDYHKPSDDLDKINIDGAVAIGDMAGRVVRALMVDTLAPDYVKVTESKPLRSGFRVSLGTIPDYASQADGVQLSGVRPGGAAERAGLQKGDVIQKLGGREIHNIDDYMAAFGVLQPNVEIDVEILRGTETKTLKLTPDAPRRR